MVYVGIFFNYGHFQLLIWSMLPKYVYHVTKSLLIKCCTCNVDILKRKTEESYGMKLNGWIASYWNEMFMVHRMKGWVKAVAQVNTT